METILELISATTTQSGLTVTAVQDLNTYEKGIEVSDEEFSSLNISRHQFHGDWNYSIAPQAS